MSDNWHGLDRYGAETRSSSYTLALVLPFLVIYEVGLLALRLSNDDFHARNGADALIRFVLFPLGVQRAGPAGAFIWSLISALVLLACFLLWRSYEKDRPPFRKHYAGWLFAESTGWALFLFVCSIAFFSGVLSADAARASTQDRMLSVSAEFVFNSGAGVYEELVFRVLLVTLLSLVMTRIVHFEKTQGGVTAAVLAAVIFSLMHFGSRPGADPWGGDGFVALFVFRTVAGLFFSLLFYYRSFGVAVATHALYDNMVTLISALN